MVTNLSNAKCTELSWVAPVQLAKNNDAGSGFLIEAYTGDSVDRWYGKLAIEIDGIKAKNQIPVLMNHDPNKIVGYSTETYKDGSFFVAGKFSGVTGIGHEVKELAGEGFPWQASIGVRPLKIMSLETDEEAKVNGKSVKGPGEIWLESEVFETSFVPLGADGNTKVSTFSNFTENLSDISGDPHTEAAFDLNTELKAEFGTFEVFQAYQEMKTTGLVKIKTSNGLTRHLMPGYDFEGNAALAEKTMGDWAGSDEAKKLWADDDHLRDEFGNDLDVYLAYCEALDSGCVKIITNRVAHS